MGAEMYLTFLIREMTACFNSFILVGSMKELSDKDSNFMIKIGIYF